MPRKRLRRFFRGCMVGVVCAGAPGLIVDASAQTRSDGTAELRACLSAYHALRSYDASSSVEVRFFEGGKAVQVQQAAVRMRFRRPNRLLLTVTRPGSNRQLYCDGIRVTLYDGQANTYDNLGPAPHDLKALLPTLRAKMGVTEQLDPLFFLSHDALPATLGDVRAQGRSSLDGHEVETITGITASQRLPSAGGHGKPLSVPASRWRWSVDAKTRLLWRIETTTPGITATVPGPNGRPRAALLTAAMRHRVLTIKANESLPDAEFRFRPPAGAVEKK